MSDIFTVFDILERENDSMVVFDIDSTIMNTAPRNYHILQEAAAERPSLRDAVEKLTPDHMGWNIVDDLRNVGYDRERTLKWVHNFWGQRFFTDEYLLYDEPYLGAVEFVTRVRDAGAFIYYLTGRDVPNMKRGTVESFRKHNLPASDGVEFHLKPDFGMSDISFKKDAFRDIKAHGKHIAGIFENEPANANLFKKYFPETDVYCIDTVTSPDPEPLRDDILIFTSWEK